MDTTITIDINDYLSEYLHQCAESDVTIPSRAKQLPDTFTIYPYATFEGDTLLENEFLGVKIEDLNRLKFSPWKT